MRRYLTLLIPAIVLGGCSKPSAPDANASASEAASASAEPIASASAADTVAADKAAITAEIDRVIASYRKDKPSDFVLSSDFDRTWSRALGKGGLDFDPLCNCQDYDAAKFRHRMKSIELAGNTATAKFDLDAGWGDWSPMRLTFVRERGDWLLDDIGSKDMPSLKRDMAKAAPGSYGIGE